MVDDEPKQRERQLQNNMLRETRNKYDETRFIIEKL
jgi:hypothetical protein